MYCQNCGSEIGMGDEICPYCGQINKSFEVIREKDRRIQELEQKIIKLEEEVRARPKIGSRIPKPSSFLPWIFIFPFVFIVLFFAFFIILVSI